MTPMGHPGHMGHTPRRDDRPVPSALDAMTGHRMPGGCDDCTAHQALDVVSGVYVLTVHHDDTCPSYRGMTR